MSAPPKRLGWPTTAPNPSTGVVGAALAGQRWHDAAAPGGEVVISRTESAYDSAGALSSTVLFFNNLGWQCVESRETPVVGSPVTTTYVWGVRYIDDLVCRDRDSEHLHMMQDRQYKTLAIADASGVGSRALRLHTVRRDHGLQPGVQCSLWLVV